MLALIVSTPAAVEVEDTGVEVPIVRALVMVLVPVVEVALKVPTNARSAVKRFAKSVDEVAFVASTFVAVDVPDT